MKGISFPFRFIGGKTTTSTADASNVTKIRESIEQIILSSKAEHLEQNVGTVTSEMLFKSDGNMIGYYADQIKRDILEQEQRITDLEVFVAFDQNKSAITVVVTYKVDGKSLSQTVEI